MKRMSTRGVLWFCLHQSLICLAGLAATSNSLRASESVLVERVRSTWRAQDGETIEQIVSNVSKVAQFVPGNWGIAEGIDRTEYVYLSWTRHQDNKSDEHYVITWKIGTDGKIEVASPYAKPIELGWRALALSLIASEITDGEKNANLPFLHNPVNFNFVTTAQGKLGNLLRHGRCHIIEPIVVDYVSKANDKPTEKGDRWRVLLLVNCNIPGPRYFTRNGVITFEKREGQDWEPQSFLAKRLAAFPPGSWFDHIEPNEHEALEGTRKASANGRTEQDGSAAH
ncbi:nodulate formation efficiency C protein [Bradyrhizobium sp. Pear77]|uniref:nodulate formation efficiency C protein n=1 Tax=Bradyrhizobium TaxID=374 RepID=UPI001E2A044E|nr:MULTISPECIES: nodulate formation efficiency C protein [Bradyrhizobium]MCC8955182.1 nodulate formation efficiency C protein [Bradyrhizobium altum]MCC8968377.1 nodulate formation efficiency C protein [Bradyrhizobium oropedii]